MTPDQALEAAYNEIAAANPDQKYELFKKNYISYQVSVRAMEEYANQEAIEFFKWNGQKVAGYVEYVANIRAAVTSKEIEDALNEFEGATIGERFNLYLKQRENKESWDI